MLLLLLLHLLGILLLQSLLGDIVQALARRCDLACGGRRHVPGHMGLERGRRAESASLAGLLRSRKRTGRRGRGHEAALALGVLWCYGPLTGNVLRELLGVLGLLLAIDGWGLHAAEETGRGAGRLRNLRWRRHGSWRGG